MPCQCSTTAFAEGYADTLDPGCGCTEQSSDGCGCGGDGAPTPSDHERSLERIVMELDKRVRRLEASR